MPHALPPFPRNYSIRAMWKARHAAVTIQKVLRMPKHRIDLPEIQDLKELLEGIDRFRSDLSRVIRQLEAYTHVRKANDRDASRG